MEYQMKPEGTDMCPPIRNRYFYGELLDVFHFELEQNYLNGKRWLLNRYVGGYGVVWGLSVQLTQDGKHVVVSPGLAIDKWGREIIVCQPSAPYPLTEFNEQPSWSEGVAEHPAAPENPDRMSSQSLKLGNPCVANLGDYHLLTICFHECHTDPVPALGGDCDTHALCSAGAIRESYKLEIRPRGLCYPQTKSNIQSAISNTGQVDYVALVKYVSELCPPTGDDCCVPLANIHVPKPREKGSPVSIDINVRPIVYTNDLLYQLVLAMNKGRPEEQTAK